MSILRVGTTTVQLIAAFRYRLTHSGLVELGADRRVYLASRIEKLRPFASCAETVPCCRSGENFDENRSAYAFQRLMKMSMHKSGKCETSANFDPANI